MNEKQNKFIEAFNYKVIYAFTVDDTTHKGLIKIGDATLNTDLSTDKLPPNCRELNQAALRRIKEYTNTVGVTPVLLHTELAVKTVKSKDGSMQLKAFRDHDVHRILENSGIQRAKIAGTTGREWYPITKETAIEAINAVKNNYANLSNTASSEFVPIIFRPEQKKAIEQTVTQFAKGNRMLWNAKMRFGKTLCALEVIKRCGYGKTIILTHRPVVNAGWYEDFRKIFHDTEYIYGSKANGYSVDELLKKGKNFVYFASIQDLRESGHIGGRYDKNDTIFNTVWDCVIVDEAHEGTKTALGNETITAILKDDLQQTKLLALSGTPFNIMDDYDENAIYTWDYIMEQECKSEWDKQHFGDSNPYEDLPELRIYTYDLGDLLHNSNYITYEDKAFNFHEFFRTWTGDYTRDYAQMPKTAHIGDFVHEADVLSFLNLMTKKDDTSFYPYSKKEYRELFKHSLWMVPGVREAKALKELMLKHPVFGSGQFNIVNVAGSDDEESADALNSVRTAIKSAEELDTYTITLSCGKLTTGVTVPEWTAVFMLSGSFSTSAANYLQTIFRVQSPCNKNGKIKSTAYVFDFAPDRTLKMVSEAVSVSSKVGKSGTDDKKILGKFLNFCPVISVSGSRMTEYKADRLLQQLKRAYADKVVRNGFDDTNLYNDELLKLQDVDIEQFNKLKGIIGKSKAAPKQNNIPINEQGFTNEEYEELNELKKKHKKELSEEEKARLEELKKKKKVRNDAISILRGISIRMPLLIYGADIPYEDEITLDSFVKKVDDSSWKEFMPTGVTKKLFGQFKKYYDEDVFIAAGRRIRNIAREADTLNPTERVKKIAALFSNFKNPDKETVLTPWNVVNMHMSDCLGGYDFFDESHKTPLDEPRFVDRGQVTSDTFSNTSAQILEINSKTGLYPLYVTYSIYRAKCKEHSDSELTLELQRNIWNETVKNNVFVICKTPMAKQITQRTLVGYSGIKINAHCFDDLVNQMKNKPQQFVDRVLKSSFWKKEGDKMKFDAIVGNPPYQEETGGAGRQAKPIYNYFVTQAKMLNANYVSMITPSRWFSGGMGLNDFRDSMISDNKLVKIIDFINAKDCFPQISIGGGVNYFLWSKDHNGNCIVKNVYDGKSVIAKRPTNEFPIFVRYNNAVSILHKILSSNDFKSIDEIISPLMPFGLATNYRGRSKQSSEDALTLYSSTNKTYISTKEVSKGSEYIGKYKVMMSKMSAEHAGEPDKNGKFSIFTKSMKVLLPDEVCTHSYFLVGSFDSKEEANNTLSYLKTKFVRFVIMTTLSAVNLSKLVFANVPMQNFTVDSDIDWSKPIPEIDKQLYAKYDLTEDEIAFIEEKIKPMDITSEDSYSQDSNLEPIYEDLPQNNSSTKPFDISLLEIYKAYNDDSEVSEILNSGRFIYINNHLCIFDNKYISIDISGNFRLTDYACSHLDECCIAFYKDVHSSVQDLRVDFSVPSDLAKAEFYNSKDIPESIKNFVKSGVLDNLSDEAKTDNDKKTLNDLICTFMDREKTSIGKLAEEAYASEDTIKRIRKDNDYHPGKEVIIGIAIVLKLSLKEAELLLNSAGYTLETSRERDIFYKHILSFTADMNKEAINGHLENGKNAVDLFCINEVCNLYHVPLLGSSKTIKALRS